MLPEESQSTHSITRYWPPYDAIISYKIFVGSEFLSLCPHATINTHTLLFFRDLFDFYCPVLFSYVVSSHPIIHYTLSHSRHIVFASHGWSLPFLPFSPMQCYAFFLHLFHNYVIQTFNRCSSSSLYLEQTDQTSLLARNESKMKEKIFVCLSLIPPAQIVGCCWFGLFSGLFFFFIGLFRCWLFIISEERCRKTMYISSIAATILFA